MHNLNYQLKLLCRHNADGSYATQANRLRMLQLAARQLKELGYRKMSAQSLKPKHVEALVQRWQEEGLTTGTLDNRLSALRRWAERVGKRGVGASSNDHFGLTRRVHVCNVSKGRTLPDDALRIIPDVFVRMSLMLQATNSQRHKESI